MRSALLAAAALGLAVIGSAGARADTPKVGAPANPADDPWADLVFLPESGLSVLLERDPRGVLLDREGYLDLHRRARAARAPELDPSVAERVLVARCEADGVVEEERVRWRVRMSIAVRGGGRETVALPAAGSVVAAFLDGVPAPLAASPDGKSLLLTIRGDGVHESLVEVLAPVRKHGGRSDVIFPLPAAAALRWSLEIPGPVTAETRLRASRVEKLADPPRTRVVGYPDASAPRVETWWRAGDEGTDLPPLVGGSVRTLLEVGERAATALSIVRVEVARRPASRVPLLVPAGWTVLGLDADAPVSLAGRGAEEGVQDLVFSEAFTGLRTVTLRLARALDGPGALEFRPPALRCEVPAECRLAVRWLDGLRGVADAGAGAVREDATAAKGEGAVDARFRVSVAGTRVALRTERPRARVVADVRAVLDLAEDGPWLSASFLYRPRGDRLYAVEPLLPAGFTPESVAVSGDPPFVRSLAPDGRLSIVFPGGVDDGAAVAVIVRGRLPLDGWTAEDWTERVVPLPRVGAGPADRSEGLLGVGVPAGIEVREEDAGGLSPAPVNELRERGGFTTEGLTLGYRFEGAVAGGSVRAQRRPASFTASSSVVAAPEEDHLRFEAAVAISVQRSGVREVRVRVAPAQGDRLRVEGADVAERRREPGQGFDTWIVRFARRVQDGTVVLLRGDLPLAAGGASVPLPSVEGAARSDLRVGLAGGGELEVTADAKGLRDADPAEGAHLLGPSAAGLLRSWTAERGAVPSLSVSVARLPAAALPPAFADRVDLRTVLADDGVARTRLSAVIRNADRQTLEVVFPAGADLRTARVRGEPVRPLVGADGRVKIPLVRSPEPFEVILFWEEPRGVAAGAAALRAPDLGIPGGPWTWTVRLPDGSVAAEAGGDFSAPTPPAAPPLLVRWVRALFPPGGFDVGVSMKGAADRMAVPAAPMPAAALPALEDEASEMEKGDAAKGPPPAKPTPVAEPTPVQRIAARAAREGLFGMDLRLREAGPVVTASRLSPGASLSLTWRTRASRAAAAVVAALLALAAAWIARRRGVGAPTWTVLALGLFTAAPIVLASSDALPWDAAAGATLAFAFAAGVARLHARGLERRARRTAELRASAARVVGLGLLALVALAGAAPAAEEKAAPPKPEPAPVSPPPPLPTGPIAVYDPDRPGSLENPEKVFLSYDRWLALWNAANPEQRIEPARAPILATAAYEARVEERMLVAFARYEVDSPDGGLVALPPGAALAGVRVGGRPAAATAASPGGPVLVAVPRSAPGERVVVEATLRWPIGGREPGGSVKAALPPAPDCRIALVLPLEDPVVAVTAAGGWTAAKAPGGGTRVEAELGPVPVLDLRWSPRGAEAAGGRLRLETKVRTLLRLRDDGASLMFSPTLEIASGEIDRVSIALPDGWQPAHVIGPAVGSWTVAGAGAERRLVVRLSGVPEKGTMFHVVAHRPGPAPLEGLAVPSLAIDGAASEEVTVYVAAGGGTRLVAAAAENWTRVDLTGLEGPSDIGIEPARGESWQAAWRRTRSPSRLVVRTEALPRTLEVDARVHLFLGAAASRLRAVLAIRPGLDGLHEARVALPDGWTLDEISGGTPFAEPGLLRIAFPPPATEARTVTLLLRGPAAGDGPFAVPSMAVAGATRASTDYLVATAPGLAATAAESRGLDPVPAARFADWPVLDPSEERALAFRDARGGGALALRREALRPALRPMVISEVTVLDDRAIVDALIVFEVRGGLAGTFRFRAPAGVRDVWVLGEGLREVRTATVDGREVSTVTLQAPAAGEVMFRALYEIPVPAGGEAVVSGPEPLDAEGARAFLMVRAAGDAEARLGDAPGLDPCDMADLPKVPAGLDPARILRFFRAREAGWRLPLRLVAHEVAGIPDARIHLVDAVTVVDRDGGHRTRVDARLFNRALAFLAVELPAGADLEAVIAAGIPVRPVTRASAPGRVFVPLRRQSLGEDSQTVSVMFAVRAPAGGAAFGSLEPRLPVFPDTPIDATTWRLLLPEGRDYSFSGNLDPVEEIEVELSRAEAYASDIQRLRKVALEGSYAQQAAATENVFRNSDDLLRTLETAKSRIADLEQAAKEGRVDAERVAATRKKADALAREMNEALKDVQDKAVAKRPAYGGARGEIPPDSRTPMDPEPAPQGDGQQQELARYGTREGQQSKQWADNFAATEARAGAAEKERRQEEAALGAAFEGRRNAEGKSKEVDATLTAYKFHADFDRPLAESLGDPRLAGDMAAARGAEPAMPDGGELMTTPGGVAPRSTRRDGRLHLLGVGGGGGGAGLVKRGFVNFDGTDLGQDGGASARPVAGLVSLAPPLVERGRSYAFRKLDAGASLKISTRPADLVVRSAAGVGFLLLVGLVALVRRRRAAIELQAA